VDRQTRIDLGLDEFDAPDWEFGGFHFPYQLVRDSYHAYAKHGVLLVAGGYLDQPAAWWDDMRTYRALYDTRYAENLKEKQHRDG
jgi:hypothetical protein